MSVPRDALFLVGGAALLWYLLKEKLGAPGGALDTGIARPIAYIISALTLPPAVHVIGGAVLPDGGYVSWDAIVDAGSKLDSRGEFMWRNLKYRVTTRRADGNYDAIRV